MNTPDFFIIGAAKAGTTSMHNHLSQHPDIFMSEVKEPHFFSNVKPNPAQAVEAITSEGEYSRLFDGRGAEHVAGESSPSYLWDDATPARIKERVPGARAIAILREPVGRAYSHYLMDVRLGIQKLAFHDALVEDFESAEKGWGVSHLYVELGMYEAQVSRWIRVFGRERMLVLFFEEFIADPASTLRTAAEFLGVAPEPMEGVHGGERHNAYAAPRSGLSRILLGARGLRRVGKRVLPESAKNLVRDKILLRKGEKPVMDPDSVRFLEEIYGPERPGIEAMLGRGLPWMAGR